VLTTILSWCKEHVSGAGAENGAERAQKSDERDRIEAGSERSGSGAGAGLEKIRWSWSRERSGEQAESAAHNPLKLKPNND